MSDIKKYDKEFLMKALRDMLLIRRFEEKAAQMYGLRKIGGFLHLYNGQEAVAVGAVAALDLAKDYMLTSYRDHGHALAVGMSPESIMAELFGKITGCVRGKGGSMHMFDVDRHFLGGNGIVGAQIPIATGVAFKHMYDEDGGVTLCFFGDGAIHQGAFHESLNLAKIWNIPIVYIVENNHFGMGTAVSRVSSVDDFSAKAAGYDL
nr:thiamine pyrophosphate-dependent enzyme [Spirochaeta sp.]